MIFDTLRSARITTNCEFVPKLAQRHHFVKLLRGGWTRTLGPPDSRGLKQVGSRTWHQVKKVEP